MRRGVVPYLASAALIALATGVVALVRLAVNVDNTSMIYLLAVLAVALMFGSRAAILTAIGSLVAFNFFFVEPKHTFEVAHEGDWVGLALLLITGIITGQLAAELGDRARRAEQREKEAAVLYDVVRLISEPALPDALDRLAERLRAELDLSAVAISLGNPIDLQTAAGDTADLARAPMPMILSSGASATASSPARPGRWIRVINPGRDRPATANVRVIPIRSATGQVGSISIARSQGAHKLTTIDDRLLSTVAHQLGQTMERLRLRKDATDAEVLRRTDEVRSALLSAVSHDLRTPLSSIIATGGNLLSRDVEWTDAERRSFIQLIVHEARRLDSLVGSLLDLSRIEAGALVTNKALHDLPSLVNEVVGRMELAFPDARFTVHALPGLPAMSFDYVEIEQVLSNLLENAARHSDGEISASIVAFQDEVRVEIEDAGPGIPTEDMDNLFRPFSSGTISGDRVSGTGLGLAIARGFVTAHGGRIWAENTDSGARFVFTLPATADSAAPTAA